MPLPAELLRPSRDDEGYLASPSQRRGGASRTPGSQSKTTMAIAASAVLVLLVTFALYSASRAGGRLQRVVPAPQPPMRAETLPGRLDPELAHALRRGDVTLYGSMGCPHTVRQLDVLGGRDRLRYVECGPGAADGRCAKIHAYPTWEINGQLHPGFRTPDALASMLHGGAPTAHLAPKPKPPQPHARPHQPHARPHQQQHHQPHVELEGFMLNGAPY